MKLRSRVPSAFAALVLAAAFASSPAAATTYQMVSDADLADQAAVIVQARTVSVDAAPTRRRPSTDYQFEVERLIKGDLAGSTIVVRVPGGIRPDGFGLKIWGAPEFLEGDRALLFLSPAADGTYRILHLMLGAFHERTVGGKRVALRNLSEAAEVGKDGRPVETTEPVRDLARFSGWLADRARGIRHSPEYRIAAPAAGLGSASDPYSFLSSSRGNPIRWFRFDSGQSVSWRVHAAGQPGLGLAATVDAFRVALQAWNADPGTDILYNYAGTTEATGGLRQSDNVSAILFDDPYRDDPEHDVDGTFRCPGGGVIAMGGPFFFTSTRTHDGAIYHETVEADIVTNDGTDCFFQDNPRAAEEVFAHELGHTLGLGHSSSSGALMRAIAHNDGRGAQLNSDDRAGIAVLYGNGVVVPGEEPPAAPAGLTAQALSGTEVQLAWSDNSSNEESFRLERKTGNGSFQEIRTLAANTTQATVSGLTAGTAYSFRVRARNEAGTSAYSNVAGLTTPGGTTPGPAAPSGLTVLARSATEVLLAWNDNAANAGNETAYRIERRTGGGAFQEVGTLPADTASARLGGLAPNTSYAFRVRAARNAQNSAYSNTASAATPPSAAAASCNGIEVLCLAGQRFRVEVDWRSREGAGGKGRFTRSSDKTGTVWFFGPSNIELIVKMLDGGALNGNFWVFGGALSDVEYWIKVTDTQSGRIRLYHNRAGDVRGFADTAAFPSAGGAAAPALTAAQEIRRLAPPPVQPAPATEQVAAGTCTAGSGKLCLGDGRFQVEVRWRNQHAGGAQGTGGAIPGTGNTGYFWFFDDENVELVVKVLDGRALNGKFWVFSGGLSDVEYWIRVTDTQTGRVRTYRNPPGNLAGVSDTGAF